jgi:hypothetical protein
MQEQLVAGVSVQQHLQGLPMFILEQQLHLCTHVSLLHP